MRRIAVAALLLFALSGCRRTPTERFTGEASRSARESPVVTVKGPLASYADVVDRVAPAVVTIRAARRVREPQQFPFSDDPFFRRFFGERGMGTPRPGRRPVERALGSGVIVGRDGHILTNHHVVDGAEEIKVDLSDHRTLAATLVGSDPPSDLAVLKVDSGNLPSLSLADSNRVRVGDICLALGNPLGIGQTVTAGIVSAKGRSTGLSTGSYEDFLQTDAPINQGNSGGALVNTTGELIGINSQILSPTGTNIGIGFAVPSNMAKNVMDQLVSNKKVRRGQLGVGIQPVTSDVASNLGLKDVRGVLVNSVTAGGPAERGGVHTGDVITAMNGSPIEDPNSFRNRIATTAPGTSVNLTVMRDGKEQQVTVKLGELNPQTGKGERPSEESEAPGSGRLGISAEPLTPAMAEQLGIRKGVQGVLVREVDPDGPAAAAGVEAGDVIAEVNRKPVRTTSDITSALKQAGSKPSLLLIQRGEQSLYLTANPR